MSDDTDPPGAAYSNLGGTLEVKGYQLDSGCLGSVQGSINLFRGDVNLPLALASLPGRNGLDVNVTALYSSHVQQAAGTANAQAPTGILGLGWTLGVDAIVCDITASASPFNATYYLYSQGSANRLLGAGLGRRDGETVVRYLATSHEFWEILFFPDADRWEITREDGVTSVYGDPGLNAGTVQWSIRHDAWVGSSARTGTQFATAWNLAQIRHPFGDTVSFAYLEDLCPIGGTSYTRASYLSRIVDAAGRSFAFTYLAKQPGEYQAPHVDAEGQNPAWQDRYETQYLDSILVRSASGATLFDVHCQYALLNFVDETRPEFDKRCLVGVTRTGTDGSSRPGLRFTYCTGRTGPNVGALASITYPEGGEATYTYAPQALGGGGQVGRRMVVEAPPGAPTPRVWFGPDYAVITWHDAAAQQVTLAPYCLAGAWFGDADMPPIPARVANDSLRVVTSADFFALSFTDTDGQFQVQLFHKDLRRPGRWMDPYVAPAVAGSTTQDSPLVAGDNFVAYCPHGSGTVQQLTWQPLDQAWESEERNVGGPFVALGAGPNYYTVFAYDANDQGTVSLFCLDTQLEWHDPPVPGSISRLYRYQGQPVFSWQAGAAFAVATYVVSVDDTSVTYQVGIYQWNTDFSGIDVRQPPAYVSPAASGLPAGFSVIADALVGSAQYLLRFDGDEWKAAQLKITVTGEGSVAFDYGSDLAVLAQKDGTVVAQQFDPSVPSWRSLSFPRLPPGANATQPQVSGDYLVIGTQVYHRSPASTWDLMDCALPPDANPASVRNAAPLYIACERGTGGATNSELRLIENGALGAPILLAGERFCVDGPAKAGTALAGGSMLVTYAAEAGFDQASRLTLYAISPPALTPQGEMDAQVDYPVAALTVDDGYARRSTAFRYEPDAAVYDPSGRIAQYPVVRVFPGVSEQDARNAGDDPEPVEGLLEYQFFNGVDPDRADVYWPGDTAESYGLLGGHLVCTRTYDAGRRCVAAAYNVPRVWRSSGGQFLPAGFVRVASAITTSEITRLFSVPNSPALVRFLDGVTGTPPPELSAAFAAAAAPPFTDIDASPERAGERWVLHDLTNHRMYFAALEGQDIAVHGGVSESVTTDYDDASGLPVRRTTYNRRIDNTLETVVQDITYAYQAYPAVLAAHLLVPQVQATVTVNGALGASSVTTFRDWSGQGAWAADAQYRSAGTSPAYDFARGGDQEGWQATSRILSRRPCGLVVESVGPDGARQSSVYDQADQYPVASFQNAALSAGEASFYGAEPYETNPGWAVVPGNEDPTINARDSHAGTRSIELHPAATGGLQLAIPALRPTNGNRKYIFSCRYKTTRDFDRDAGTVQWALAAAEPGGGTASTTIALSNTNGAWAYAMGCLDLASLGDGAAGPVAVTLLASNRKAREVVLLDELRFSPLAGAYTARLYDPATKTIAATLAENGVTVRSLRDGFQSVVAAIGPDENPAVIQVPYFSRTGNGDRFAPADPNFLLGLTAAGAGQAPRFVEGTTDWQDFWQPEAAGAADWAFDAGALRHLQAVAGRLTVAESGGFADACLLVTISADVLTAPVALCVGSFASVRWLPGASGAHWELVDESTGQPVATSPQPSPAGTHRWLLVVLNGALLFFLDGQRVFAWQAPRVVAGSWSLATADRIAVSDPVVFQQPQVSASYRSGIGQDLQSQLLEGRAGQGEQGPATNALVTGVLHDAVGRPAIKTKPVRYGSGLLAYRPGLLAAVDWQTGVAQGDAVGYYSLGGGGFSDDEGYPYLRTLYEASPLARVLATGNPGKVLAITDASDPGKSPVQRCAYGANGVGDVFADLKLYSGEFFLKTSTDANGVATMLLRDRRGREVLRRTLDASQPAGSVTTGLDYDAMGRCIVSKPPRYYETGDAAWISTTVYDPLGRVTATSSPDQPHPAQVVYDGASRCRCILTGAGAEADPPYVLYMKYDGLSRLTEAGWFATPWDRENLQRQVEDPAWPAQGNWWKRFSYDADGASATDVGQLTRTEVCNAAGAPPDVVERFTFDARGQLRTLSRTVPADSPTPFEAGFSYDLAGRLSAIDYPAMPQAAPERVVYERNSLGQVVRIAGGADGSTTYATYRYNAAGLPEAETWTAGSAAGSAREWQYNSPGWLTRVADPFFAQDLEYFPAAGSKGCYDGQITGAAYRFTWPSAPPPYRYDLGYDAIGNLTSARNEALPAGSIDALAYDGNGNVLQVTSAAGTRKYGYAAGGNRLVNTDGSGDIDCLYDANGNVRSVSPKMRPQGLQEIVSHAFSGLPASIRTGDGRQGPGVDIAFAYGADDQRVRKTVLSQDGTTTKLYVSGRSGIPLHEKSTTGQACSVTTYIHGVDGLLAFRRDGRLYYVAKDHTRSTRAVVDVSGASPAVAASYDYTPFGAPLRVTGDAAVLAYLFTGLEQDAETGLHATGRRLYDPHVQRFLGMDPAGQFGTPYGYAFNDPLQFTDPSGLWSIKGWFQDVAALAVSAAEVVAGAAVDALSGGTLEAVGGALIGAGTSGMLYTATHWNSFSWNDFGVEEGIGAAIGLATAGVGAAFRSGATAAADVAEEGTAVEMADLAGARSAAARAGGDLSEQVGRCATRGQCAFGDTADGAAACFAEGTSVATEAGPVPIEALREGDHVWAFDVHTGGSDLRRVQRLYTHEAAELLDVIAGADTLVVTPGHPFWTVGRGWVAAGDLRAGDRLVGREGEDLVVTQAVRRSDGGRVHNIEVDGWHTYYAGSAGLLVHNMCGGQGVEMAGQRAPADLDWVLQSPDERLGQLDWAINDGRGDYVNMHLLRMMNDYANPTRAEMNEAVTVLRNRAAAAARDARQAARVARDLVDDMRIAQRARAFARIERYRRIGMGMAFLVVGGLGVGVYFSAKGTGTN